MNNRVGHLKNTLYCSFCGKSQHEVAQLISGALAYICDECVALSAEIIAQKAGGASAPLYVDAARYRYLRNRPEDAIGKGGIFAGSTPNTGSGGSILTEHDLDRAVDAAIADEQRPAQLLTTTDEEN